jgi:hypothetical protein
MARRRRMKAPPYVPLQSRMIYCRRSLQPQASVSRRAIHSPLGCAVTSSQGISRTNAAEQETHKIAEAKSWEQQRIYRRDASAWLRRKVFQPCDGDRLLEQLAVNPQRSRQRVSSAHVANKLANSTSIFGRPPHDRGATPTEYRLRLEDFSASREEAISPRSPPTFATPLAR